jgi:hypothetical protein
MVDMSKGNKGYIEFRNGQKLWAVFILPEPAIDKNMIMYRIRLDIGAHLDVHANGQVYKDKESPHDVVKFNPQMKWLEAVRDFIPTEISLC